MIDWSEVLKNYGVLPFFGLYVLIKDILPLVFNRWLPSRIKERERKNKIDEAEIIWRRNIEERSVKALETLSATSARMEAAITENNRLVQESSNGLSKQFSDHDYWERDYEKTITGAISELAKSTAILIDRQNGSKSRGARI